MRYSDGADRGADRQLLLEARGIARGGTSALSQSVSHLKQTHYSSRSHSLSPSLSQTLSLSSHSVTLCHSLSRLTLSLYSPSLSGASGLRSFNGEVADFPTTSNNTAVHAPTSSLSSPASKFGIAAKGPPKVRWLTVSKPVLKAPLVSALGGRCRLTVSKPVSKVAMVSALETGIS